MATYYKYRDFGDIIHLTDILLNNRLYACSHEKLNDPMEGKFLYSGNSKDYKKRILQKENKRKIGQHVNLFIIDLLR